MGFHENLEGLRHNPRHKKPMTLQELASARAIPIQRPKPLFDVKLTEWGIAQDDPDAKTLRHWFESKRLSSKQEFLLFMAAEAIADAELAKDSYNPKADSRYTDLCNIAGSAARLTKTLNQMFPPSAVGKGTQLDVLVVTLSAFVEGAFNATRMTDVSLSSSRVRRTLAAMEGAGFGGHFYWDQIATLSWLASGKSRQRVSESTVRRYLNKSKAPDPAHDCWKRNRRDVWETVWSAPQSHPHAPDWKYDPASDGLPRLVPTPTTKRQRQAIAQFTDLIKDNLRSDERRSNPQKPSGNQK